MKTLALKRGLVALAAASAIGLGSCTDYLKRRDTILLGAGEAVQTNMVTHVIDPWPAHARRTRGPTDGDRLQRAIVRYRDPRAGADASSSSQAATSGAAAAPAPARAP